MRALQPIAAGCLLLANLLAPAAALPIGFGGRAEVDYQQRHFRTGGTEYDLDFGGLSIRPTVNFTDRWEFHVLLGYSRVAFDRPAFGATEYDEWGFCWGAGTSYTLFRWSGLYGVLEAAFSRTDTERDGGEDVREEGDLDLWGAEARAGWDFSGFGLYAGEAYADGRLDYRYRSAEREISEEYDLTDNWRPFAGARVDIPPFTNLEGRYYFGKGVIALFSVGVKF